MLVVANEQHKEQYDSGFGKFKPHLFGAKAEFDEGKAGRLCLVFLRQNMAVNYFLQVDCAALNILFLLAGMLPVETPLVDHIIRRMQFEIYEIAYISQLVLLALSAARYGVAHLAEDLVVCVIWTILF